jgi:nitroreductase
LIWNYEFGEIVLNPVLKAIRERRSSVNFKSTPVTDEDLDAILEAGRWAPSWTNTQPWRFIVVKDEQIKEKMSEAVLTFFKMSIKEAPVCIAVCVNPKVDPFHFVEDGTNATQNMALAAQSLGLSTSWIGVFSVGDEKNSSERKVKEVLKIPKNWRLISVLPVGSPKFKLNKKRKDLSELLDSNTFEVREEKATILETQRPSEEEIATIMPSSAREHGRALV